MDLPTKKLTVSKQKAENNTIYSSWWPSVRTMASIPHPVMRSNRFSKILLLSQKTCQRPLMRLLYSRFGFVRFCRLSTRSSSLIASAGTKSVLQKIFAPKVLNTHYTPNRRAKKTRFLSVWVYGAIEKSLTWRIWNFANGKRNSSLPLGRCGKKWSSRKKGFKPVYGGARWFCAGRGRSWIPRQNIFCSLDVRVLCRKMKRPYWP